MKKQLWQSDGNWQGQKVGGEYRCSSGFLITNLPCVFLRGGGSLKRLFLACVAVVFLLGISSVSFASGKGDDMKGKGEEMSTEAKGKSKGKEMGKPKKEPKKESVEQ